MRFLFRGKTLLSSYPSRFLRKSTPKNPSPPQKYNLSRKKSSPQIIWRCFCLKEQIRTDCHCCAWNFWENVFQILDQPGTFSMPGMCPCSPHLERSHGDEWLSRPTWAVSTNVPTTAVAHYLHPQDRWRLRHGLRHGHGAPCQDTSDRRCCSTTSDHYNWHGNGILECGRFKDAFPIENGNFSLPCLFPGVYLKSSSWSSLFPNLGLVCHPKEQKAGDSWFQFLIYINGRVI